MSSPAAKDAAQHTSPRFLSYYKQGEARNEIKGIDSKP